MFGTQSALRLFGLTAMTLTLVAQATGCTCGSGPYQGDYFDGDRPNAMKNVKFVESDKGDPKVVGCADGQREGFADIKANPRVAGCVGVWEGSKSLRDKPTGKACGDDGAKCNVPADLCSEGWHVCGMEGKAEDMRDRAKAKACDTAGPGRFNAAVSHSPTDEIDPCPKITKATVLPCVQAGLGAEPVCCGNDCLSGKCKDGVWKGRTRISRGTTEGCGAVTSERNGGIMCCYDGDDDPGAGAGGDEKAADTDDSAAVLGAGDAKGGDGPDDGKGGEKADAKADAGGDTKTAADAKKGDAKKGDAKKGDAKKGDAKKGDAKKGGGKKKGEGKADEKKAG